MEREGSDENVQRKRLRAKTTCLISDSGQRKLTNIRSNEARAVKVMFHVCWSTAGEQVDRQRFVILMISAGKEKALSAKVQSLIINMNINL